MLSDELPAGVRVLEGSVDGGDLLVEGLKGHPKAYVRSYEALLRICHSGGRKIGFGAIPELVPRISRVAFEDLRTLHGRTVDGQLEPILGRIDGLDQSFVRDFIAGRRVVLAHMKERDLQYVVPDCPKPRMDLLLDGDMPAVTPRVKPNWDAKARRYSLVQVLSDPEVRAKYEVPATVWNSALRVCVFHPAAAARMLQDFFQSGHPELKITVEPKGFGVSTTAALTTIRQLTHALGTAVGGAEAEIVGDQLFIYGPKREGLWHVSGPLKYAAELNGLYRLVEHLGTFDAMFLLALDTLQLGMEIYNGSNYETGQYEPHVLAPENDEELGGQVFSRPGSATAASEEGFLLELGRSLPVSGMVMPVCDDRGRRVASAVRLTEAFAVMNGHVFDHYERVMVNGQPVRQVRQIARDVWVVVATGQMPGAWVMREPVLHEDVAVVVPDATGAYDVSPMLRIEGFAGDTVRISKSAFLCEGKSGGALVAVSDGALLGIYCGTTVYQGLVYYIGKSQYGGLLETDMGALVSRAAVGGDDADAVYARFKARGLGHLFRAAMKAIKPMYHGGRHRAMALHVAGALWSLPDLCPPILLADETVVQMVEESTSTRSLCRWEAKTGDVDVTEGTSALPMARMAELGEEVVVLGLDGDGGYVSKRVRVASLLPGARGCTLEDFSSDVPMGGGLVLALRDCVPVAVYSHRQMTAISGSGIVCYAVPQRASNEEVPDPTEFLAEKFPFMDVRSWPCSVMEEVFSHSSIPFRSDGRPSDGGPRKLAFVGDAMMRVALGLALRAQDTPGAEWNREVQHRQNNGQLATQAWSSGLAKYLRVGHGTELPHDSKAYADVVEALVGAASIHEPKDNVWRLCLALDVIPCLPARCGG